MFPAETFILFIIGGKENITYPKSLKYVTLPLLPHKECFIFEGSKFQRQIVVWKSLVCTVYVSLTPLKYHYVIFSLAIDSNETSVKTNISIKLSAGIKENS